MTLALRTHHHDNARIFTSGNSQAVRLPKAYRIDTDSVRIEKIGSSVLLTPMMKTESWEEKINRVFATPTTNDDTLIERHIDLPPQDRDNIDFHPNW